LENFKKNNYEDVMTIISALSRQRNSLELYPLAKYCKDSYLSYKCAIETIVNSSKNYESIEMVEFPIKAKGPNDESLSIVAVKRLYGAPRHVVIRFSGTHGIEGYIGAAGQFYEIESTFNLPHNTMLIEILGYNVWGFCNLRRSSSKNHDYNFIHSPKSTSDLNNLYQEAVNMKGKSFKRTLSFPLLKRKKSTGKISKLDLQELLSKGQNECPRGLFYNDGDSLDEGTDSLFTWLEKQLSKADCIVCVDVHSEPGTWCQEQLTIFNYENNYSTDAFASYFGSTIQVLNGDEALNGDVCSKVFEVVKKVRKSAEVIGVRQTIETYPIRNVISALFNENQAYMELEKDDKKFPCNHEYKIQLLDCFYPSSPHWRHVAVTKLHELFEECIDYATTSKTLEAKVDLEHQADIYYR
jgi:Protein of unknown function (DUF2817)